MDDWRRLPEATQSMHVFGVGWVEANPELEMYRKKSNARVLAIVSNPANLETLRRFFKGLNSGEYLTAQGWSLVFLPLHDRLEVVSNFDRMNTRQPNGEIEIDHVASGGELLDELTRRIWSDNEGDLESFGLHEWIDHVAGDVKRAILRRDGHAVAPHSEGDYPSRRDSWQPISSTSSTEEIEEDSRLPMSEPVIAAPINSWRNWWRWPLMPVAAVGAGLITMLLVGLLNEFVNSTGRLPTWYVEWVVPVVSQGAGGFAFGWMAHSISPSPKRKSSLLMTFLLAAVCLSSFTLILHGGEYPNLRLFHFALGGLAIVLASFFGRVVAMGNDDSG